MLKELIKIANELDSMGLVKEADALDAIVLEASASKYIFPLCLSLVGGCASESELIRLDDDYGYVDTGGAGDAEDVIDSQDLANLPDCTQEIEWHPAPSDPRWEDGGIPMNEFRMKGKNETIGADQMGEYLLSESTAEALLCVWDYVPDSASYWDSEFNVWNTEEADNSSNMDHVDEAYGEHPLLKIQINFPIEERYGIRYLLPPTMGTGGSLSFHPPDDECIREYLEAIEEGTGE